MNRDDFQRVAIEKLLNRLVTPKYPNIIDHIDVVYNRKDELVVKVYIMDGFNWEDFDKVDNTLSNEESGIIDWSITDALRYLGGIRYWLEFVWPNRFDS